MVEDIFGILGMTLAGTFHVEEVIAEGGFGVVYRAEHVAFRAPVALKCLKIPGTISPSQSEMFVENFREEAEILFHLSAQIPEVVRPLHADAMTLADGTFVPYIAMEWVEGRPLDSIIIMREDDGLPPLSIRNVLKMLTPIALALAKAHHFQVPGGAVVSVTHCDLKPENILITERDNPVRAKVLDFGIAKARDTMRQNVGRITDSEHNRPFTPSYGAPEQWVPKRYGQSGPWTDVWGLALTAVECLTGRPPIDGDMHAMMGTALDKGRRPTPRNEGAEITDELEAVFRRALAVDPRQRYDTIEEFWTALETAGKVASSFARLRRRMDNTLDEDGAAKANELADEFDGLESEEDSASLDRELELGMPAKGAGPKRPPRPPPPPRHPQKAPSGSSSPPTPKSSVDSNEFFLETTSQAPISSGRAPASEAPPAEMVGSIDLDLQGSLAPAAMRSSPSNVAGGGAKVQAAVTSGTWARPDVKRSAGHEAATPSSLRARGSVAVQTAAEETKSLRSQLRTPILLVAIGLGFTVVDMLLARTLGGTLALGPVKVRWIAAGLAAIGIIMAFWNLLGDREE